MTYPNAAADGGLAFGGKRLESLRATGLGDPSSQIAETATTVTYPGMTLRDYFAAKAMQAILSHTWPDANVNPDDVAEWAGKQADAMLKERSK